jgi:four helix bundle protein
MSKYQTLDAWKISMELVKKIYLITSQYPREELYSLTSQTKRAAISIPSNIAEGMGRQYKKDALQFLYISRGSLYELETLLNLALLILVIDQVIFTQTIDLVQKSLQVLNGLISYLKNSSLK